MALTEIVANELERLGFSTVSDPPSTFGSSGFIYLPGARLRITKTLASFSIIEHSSAYGITEDVIEIDLVEPDSLTTLINAILDREYWAAKWVRMLKIFVVRPIALFVWSIKTFCTG